MTLGEQMFAFSIAVNISFGFMDMFHSLNAKTDQERSEYQCYAIMDFAFAGLGYFGGGGAGMARAFANGGSAAMALGNGAASIIWTGGRTAIGIGDLIRMMTATYRTTSGNGTITGSDTGEESQYDDPDEVPDNNAIGKAREELAENELKDLYPNDLILKHRMLRDSTGRKIIDWETQQGRMPDFFVVRDGKVIRMWEVTGENVDKTTQSAKTRNIRKTGQIFVRDPVTKQLYELPPDVVEEVKKYK